MRKKGLALLTAGLLLAGSIAVNEVYSTVNRQVAAEEVKQTEKIISVTGDGQIDATPDIAYIQVGVITENTDSKVAQQKNKASMINVMSALKPYNIDKKDIKTVSYYINPNYSYKDNVSKLEDYTVTNTVKITVKNLDNVGAILDATSDAGTNTSGNIQYDVADKTNLYNKALADAVKKAKGKAQAIATAAGVKLGSPSSIDETSQSTIYPIMYDRVALKSSAANDATTPTEQGTMTIKASVSIKYPMQ
jgi:uncharacterized protein YggE